MHHVKWRSRIFAGKPAFIDYGIIANYLNSIPDGGFSEWYIESNANEVVNNRCDIYAMHRKFRFPLMLLSLGNTPIP